MEQYYKEITWNGRLLIIEFLHSVGQYSLKTHFSLDGCNFCGIGIANNEQAAMEMALVSLEESLKESAKGLDVDKAQKRLKLEQKILKHQERRQQLALALIKQFKL